jgi:2-hydroxychromene-2-carboxylate isomerase
VALDHDFDVAINVRPVYPIAIRTPDFFSRVNPQFAPYLMRDTKRVAESLGLPFRWPPLPDPVVMDMASYTIAAEQPYIHRLTRLGIAAVQHGRGLAYIDEVSRLIFGSTVDGWHEGDHLAQAAGRAGLDGAELEAAVAADAESLEAVIEANQDDHAAAGHWGVPLMVLDGEPFFGQDRFDLLVWRLEQKGLQRRTS